MNDSNEARKNEFFVIGDLIRLQKFEAARSLLRIKLDGACRLKQPSSSLIQWSLDLFEQSFEQLFATPSLEADEFLNKILELANLSRDRNLIVRSYYAWIRYDTNVYQNNPHFKMLKQLLRNYAHIRDLTEDAEKYLVDNHVVNHLKNYISLILELAYNVLIRQLPNLQNHPEQFELLIKNIKFEKDYLLSKNQKNKAIELYGLANKVLQSTSATQEEYKRILESINQELEDILHTEEIPTLPIEAIKLLGPISDLKVIRDRWPPITSPDEIVEQQRVVTLTYQTFISDIIEQTQELIGPPPCRFALIGMGSFSRQAMLPGSDIEPLLLIEHEHEFNLFYFNHLWECTSLIVEYLGESDPHFKSKFHFDLLELNDNKVTYTSEQLISKCISHGYSESGNENAVAVSLYESRLLYGDENLFQAYRDKLKKIFKISLFPLLHRRLYFDSKLWESHKKEQMTQYNGNQVVDIKKDFHSPLIFLIHTLGLLQGLAPGETIEVLKKLSNEKLPPFEGFINDCEKLYRHLQVLRWKLHQKTQSNHEAITYHHLTSQEQLLLQTIESKILIPWYHFIFQKLNRPKLIGNYKKQVTGLTIAEIFNKIYFFTSHNRKIKVWDLQANEFNKPIQTLKTTDKDDIHTFAVTDNGLVVIAWSHYFALGVWDFAQSCTKKTPTKLKWGDNCYELDYVGAGLRNNTNVLIKFQGQKIISGSKDNIIRIWDPKVTNTAPMLILSGHTDEVLAFAITQRGWIVSGSSDNNLRIWTTEDTGHCLKVLRGHQGAVTALTLATTKHANQIKEFIVSSSRDKTIKVWNLEKGTLTYSLLIQNTWFRFTISPIISLITVRWNLIVGIAESKNLIYVWQINSEGVCKEIRKGSGPHDDVITLLTKTPREEVVTASRDKTIKLWNLPASFFRTSQPSISETTERNLLCLTQ